MNDLLTALWHGAVYALVGGVLLVLAYYVLDLLTPGHLGGRLSADSDGDASHSAGLVAGAWLLSTALVLFTAIWTNGETAFGWALGWTVAFGLLGIALNTVMFLAVEVLTPGSLGDAVCRPGPVVPLATVAAAAALASSAVVCASIA
jgi:hypothetical protein